MELKDTPLNYTREIASLYSELKIANTTYEPSFLYLSRFLSTLMVEGNCLDVGCGTGRVTRILTKLLHSAHKIIGVDISLNMLGHAHNPSNQINEFEVVLIDRILPFASASIELIVCANVIEEVSKQEDLILLLSEIYRVLKKNSYFIIITANPEAIENKANYISYSYSYTQPLINGSSIDCIVNTSPTILLHDIYWTKEYIYNILVEVGFKVIAIANPIVGEEGIKGDWLDETRIAPDNVWIINK